VAGRSGHEHHDDGDREQTRDIGGHHDGRGETTVAPTMKSGRRRVTRGSVLGANTRV